MRERKREIERNNKRRWDEKDWKRRSPDKWKVIKKRIAAEFTERYENPIINFYGSINFINYLSVFPFL